MLIFGCLVLVLSAAAFGWVRRVGHASRQRTHDAQGIWPDLLLFGVFACVTVGLILIERGSEPAGLPALPAIVGAIAGFVVLIVVFSRAFAARS
jgi:presenilin-like A22 family membrane protease